MTDYTREYIEAALRAVREEFERRRNQAGLEILDSYEEGWAEYGRLTDRQIAWLERQLDGSWRQSADTCAANERYGGGDGGGAKPRHSLDEIKPVATQELSDAAIRRRLLQQGKTAVDLERLEEIEAVADGLKRAVQRLR